MKYIINYIWFIIAHIFFVAITLLERISAFIFCILSIIWNLKINKKSFRRLCYYRFGGETFWSIEENEKQMMRRQRIRTYSTLKNLYKEFYNEFIKYDGNNKTEFNVDWNFELASFEY